MKITHQCNRSTLLISTDKTEPCEGAVAKTV